MITVCYLKASWSRLDGGGQKLPDNELEEQVLSWIHEQHANLFCDSSEIIMFKAKSIYTEKFGNNKAIKDVFTVNNDWFENSYLATTWNGTKTKPFVVFQGS